MPNPKDRSDPVAQIIAAEAIAVALARRLMKTMPEAERKSFAAEMTAAGEAICAEIVGQAPAIGRLKGIAVEAANATAALITQRARSVLEAHLDELIRG